jgi:CCAAT-binding transcription factor (CBF-B/NF-YA) subunit B
MPIATNEILEEEPLYVNAKQYRRILKRRQARAKLEAEGRIPKERPVRANYFELFHSLILIWKFSFAYRNTCTSPDIVMR